MGVISSTWARLANSGTTPPNSACRSIWLATTDERTSYVSLMTAAAVSSQDVSMASRCGSRRAIQQRSRWLGPRERPFAFDTGPRPGRLTRVDGDESSAPASMTEVDVRGRAAARLVRRGRRSGHRAGWRW